MDESKWAPDPDFAKYPEHVLAQVPLAVLEAARAALQEAADYDRAVDPDDVQPLADSVVASVMPVIRGWLADTGQ